MSQERKDLFINQDIKKIQGGVDLAIEDAEDFDLSGNDILRVVNYKANIMTYKDLEKYDSIEGVLGKNGAVVILYETKKNFGHWVGLFRTRPGELEFFDPYGLDVDEELNFTKEFYLRRHGGKFIPHLTVLLDRSRYRVIHNNMKLQRFLEDVNTCGRWVSIRIRLRNTPLAKFQTMFTKTKHYDGDFFVSAMTLFC